jgi:hypothetical protein
VAHVPHFVDETMSGMRKTKQSNTALFSNCFDSPKLKGGKNMNRKSQRKTPEQMIEAIFALDLDPIKLKLMDKAEGHGWTRAQADQNELEYKRFLALLAKYPDQSIAPTTEVDKFWHGHILDTMKYAEDCENVFGYFLHHFPYFGMRGEQDAADLVNAFMNMQRLHEQEFGIATPASQHTAWCAAASGEAVDAANGKTAWCAATSEEAIEASRQSAAWCAAVSGKAGPVVNSGAAWCAAVSEPAIAASDRHVAWCAATDGAASSQTEKKAAWCAATSGKADLASENKPAWCAATGTIRSSRKPAFFKRPTLDSQQESA